MVGAMSAPAEQPREVVFPTADGGAIHALVYGAGDHGVVLAHGAVFNKESWDEQARALAAAGLHVVAIDFRDYGESKAGSESGARYQDVLGAMAWLRKDGAKKVSVVGASMGGGASARAAVEAPAGSIDALILLAGGPTERPEKMQGRKLFLVSEGDPGFERVRDQYTRAPEPKKLIVLPGSAHAQHIFKTDLGERLLREIRDWLLQ